jgi:hypothetical protein
MLCVVWVVRPGNQYFFIARLLFMTKLVVLITDAQLQKTLGISSAKS